MPRHRIQHLAISLGEDDEKRKADIEQGEANGADQYHNVHPLSPVETDVVRSRVCLDVDDGVQQAEDHTHDGRLGASGRGSQMGIRFQDELVVTQNRHDNQDHQQEEDPRHGLEDRFSLHGFSQELPIHRGRLAPHEVKLDLLNRARILQIVQRVGGLVRLEARQLLPNVGDVVGVHEHDKGLAVRFHALLRRTIEEFSHQSTCLASCRFYSVVATDVLRGYIPPRS
mmetsp:Transcript_34461/g.98916  ORF Transcript_34461/g.98916 Transcript_34461/m.98916 type:complete len:227 (-) Transcript_34461:1607-2287(-)